MVYISSASFTAAGRQSQMQIRNGLARDQNELSSGVVADAGLTLGGRSSQLVDLTQQQSLLTTLTSNNSLATTRLSSTTTALDTIRTSAQSFLSALTTATSSGGLTTSLQGSALSSLSALTSALNTSVSGQYIFAGINTAVKPVTDYVQSPASANKTAVDTAFASAFGFSQNSSSASTISGSDMQSFLNGGFASMFSASGFGTAWSSASNTPLSSQISTGQTIDTSVSANSSAFRQLSQAYTMVTELGGINFSSGASQAVLSSAVSLVSSALSSLTTTEAQVGTATTSISSANDVMKAQSDIITTQTSALVGVDPYALQTNLSSLSTQLQASYEVTSKLQSMSLVNYLA